MDYRLSEKAGELSLFLEQSCCRQFVGPHVLVWSVNSLESFDFAVGERYLISHNRIYALE
jgi:hypothetical protein